MISSLFLGPLVFGVGLTLATAVLGWVLARLGVPMLALALFAGTIGWAVWIIFDLSTRCADGTGEACSGAARLTDQITAFAVMPACVIVLVVLAVQTWMGMSARREGSQ